MKCKEDTKHRIVIYSVLIFTMGVLWMGYAPSAHSEPPVIVQGVKRAPLNLPNPCGLDVVVCPKEALAAQIVPKTGVVVASTTVKQAISDACAKYGDQCVKDLTAICTKESHCAPAAVHKNSNGTTDSGAWQINSIHKNVDPFNVKDAANWVVNYLLANGWPTRRTVALANYHSHVPAIGGPYAESVKSIADKL